LLAQTMSDYAIRLTATMVVSSLRAEKSQYLLPSMIGGFTATEDGVSREEISSAGVAAVGLHHHTR